MKTPSFKIILVILSIITNVCLAQEYDSWSRVYELGQGTLNIIYFESPGIIQGNGNQLKGLAVDVLNDFVKFVDTKYSKKIKLLFVAQETEFSTFLKTIQTTKNLLGVSGITITEERKSTMAFTPPFLISPNVLITHKDSKEVILPKDLKGYRPLAVSGSSQIEMIKQIQKKYIPEYKVEYLGNQKSILEEISTSQNSFTVLGLNDLLDANKKKLDIKMQKIDLGNPELFGFAMSKSSDWAEIWEEFLTTTYINDPIYKKQIAKNLGSAYLQIKNR